MCAHSLATSYRKQTRQLEETGVLEQRRQLEAHAAERARADAAGARQRAIERREEERQQDIAMQRELTLQRHMKQVWALPAQSCARTVPYMLFAYIAMCTLCLFETYVNISSFPEDVDTSTIVLAR